LEIAIFLAAGFAAEIVLTLVRPLRGTLRGVVCWSVAAVVLTMCCVVYFAGASYIRLDLMSAARCVGGVGAVILISAMIELFSPSRRSRRSVRDAGRPEISARSERSLNIVLAVAAGILCAAALALFLCGERDTAVILLVIPTAAALRQTFWFMRENGAEQPEGERDKLTKRISCGKYRL